MKFPYISLEPIIDEVNGELKKLYRQGAFSKDDVYNYMIEAAKMVGGNTWDDQSAAITIKNHIGALPKNFYACNGIWSITPREQEVTTVLDAFKCGQKIYRKIAPLWPGDSATVKLLTDKARDIRANTATNYYYFKIPPGTIRTSFREGTIGLIFLGLPADEKGIIMVQDEVNTLVGIKSYAKYMILEEGYIAQEVPRHIYKDIEDKALTFIDQAKAIQKMPDPANLEKHTQELIHDRYKNFKLPG